LRRRSLREVVKIAGAPNDGSESQFFFFAPKENLPLYVRTK